MPFSTLPSLNLQLPRVNYQPLPARIPNQKGLLIAEALARFLPEAMKGLNPREKLRRQNEELEYKMNLQKYEYLQKHPEMIGRQSATEHPSLTRLRTAQAIDQENKNRGADQTFDGQAPTGLLEPVKTAPTTEKPTTMVPEIPKYLNRDTQPDTAAIPNLLPFLSAFSSPTTTEEEYWS